MNSEYNTPLRVTDMLICDSRQLEPINTSPKAKALYSPFPHRKRISLFARLKRQGFPCVELKEQHRMVS